MSGAQLRQVVLAAQGTRRDEQLRKYANTGRIVHAMESDFGLLILMEDMEHSHLSRHNVEDLWNYTFADRYGMAGRQTIYRLRDRFRNRDSEGRGAGNWNAIGRATAQERQQILNRILASAQALGIAIDPRDRGNAQAAHPPGGNAAAQAPVQVNQDDEDENDEDEDDDEDEDEGQGEDDQEGEDDEDDAADEVDADEEAEDEEEEADSDDEGAEVGDEAVSDDEEAAAIREAESDDEDAEVDDEADADDQESDADSEEADADNEADADGEDDSQFNGDDEDEDDNEEEAPSPQAKKPAVRRDQSKGSAANGTGSSSLSAPPPTSQLSPPQLGGPWSESISSNSPEEDSDGHSSISSNIVVKIPKRVREDDASDNGSRKSRRTNTGDNASRRSRQSDGTDNASDRVQSDRGPSNANNERQSDQPEQPLLAPQSSAPQAIGAQRPGFSGIAPLGQRPQDDWARELAGLIELSILSRRRPLQLVYYGGINPFIIHRLVRTEADLALRWYGQAPPNPFSPFTGSGLAGFQGIVQATNGILHLTAVRGSGMERLPEPPNVQEAQTWTGLRAADPWMIWGLEQAEQFNLDENQATMFVMYCFPQTTRSEVQEMLSRMTLRQVVIHFHERSDPQIEWVQGMYEEAMVFVASFRGQSFWLAEQ